MKNAGQILKAVLSERQATNAQYSLRAFARDLQLSAPQLSNVINGHRGLSPKAAESVAQLLALAPAQKEIFKSSLKAKFSPSKADRLVALRKLEELNHHAEATYLDLDLFKVISNWYHFTLLELIKIAKKNENKVQWFSEKLGISENEVALALTRLERLALIENTGRGYRVNQDTVIADQGIPTEAIRNFHRQLLEKSMQALTTQPADERYGYSGVMPVKVKSVERAKKLIQKFRIDFAKEVSDHQNGEEIYGLCLQFFRVTQNKEKVI
jgi:uncharacterized protein (TIGR02147 family)